MGGIVCAKYVLCNPPAQARSLNELRMAEAKAECKDRLKQAMLEGLGDLGGLVESGGLTDKQVQLYHNVCAVLDGDDKTFNAAYSALRESLIVSA